MRHRTDRGDAMSRSHLIEKESIADLSLIGSIVKISTFIVYFYRLNKKPRGRTAMTVLNVRLYFLFGHDASLIEATRVMHCKLTGKSRG